MCSGNKSQIRNWFLSTRRGERRDLIENVGSVVCHFELVCSWLTRSASRPQSVGNGELGGRKPKLLGRGGPFTPTRDASACGDLSEGRRKPGGIGGTHALPGN
jgi:hypothetical protein